MNSVIIRNTNFFNFIVLGLLFCLLYWSSNVYANDFHWVPFIRLISIFLLIYHLFIFYLRKIKFLEFSVIFTLMNYLFTLSYLYIWEEGESRSVYWNQGYEGKYWLLAFVYAMCYIHAMFTGMLLFRRKKTIFDINKINQLNSVYDSKMMYRIGLIIFICTLPTKLYVDALTYFVNRSGYGYSAVLTNEQVNGVVFNLSLLVNVGLIYIICSRYLPKKKVLILFIMYYVYAFGITTLIGGRRFTVTAFLATLPALLFVYNIELKKKTIFLYFLFAYLGLVFLQTISATRTLTVASISDYIDLSIKYLSGADILFDTFYEFGNTIFPYILSIIIYPHLHGFFYGTSMIFVWILAIPGAGKMFPSLANDYGTSTYAIQNFRYFYGGAFGQELYANFGYFSIIFALFVSFFFMKIMGDIREDCYIKRARYFSLFYILLNLVRSDMYQFVRLFVWALVIPILLQKIIKK